MTPSTPTPAEALRHVLREHIESVAPGDLGSLSREVLAQSESEFEGTMALLRDLEQAGVLRLGAVTQAGTVEFERLA